MPGLLRGMARTAVVAGTATSVSNRVSRRQGRRWASKDAQEAQPAPNQAAYSSAAAGSTTDEQIDQLEKLADLKNRGILTEAEFDRKKAQILGS